MTRNLHTLPIALLELLGPNLGGTAACKGGAPGWDEQLPGETTEQRDTRHHHAATICRGCPVQTACATARADLGKNASGIWAGTNNNGTHPTHRTREMAEQGARINAASQPK